MILLDCWHYSNLCLALDTQLFLCQVCSEAQVCLGLQPALALEKFMCKGRPRLPSFLPCEADVHAYLSHRPSSSLSSTALSRKLRSLGHCLLS